MEPIKKVPFTKEMKKTHTILIPTMLPIHFRILGNVLENYGYKVKVLDNCGPGVIEQGLKNVHNDTCYPAQLVIGQMIDALEHSDLPLDKVALLITQAAALPTTSICCARRSTSAATATSRSSPPVL